MDTPALSVIVAFRNMAREAPRTLFTLSPSYQRGVSGSDYEVVAVDAGSSPPLAEEVVRCHGSNFRLVRATDAPSPAAAINAAAAGASGKAVAVCIDGARMLSPGIIRLTLKALSAWEDPVVATLAWHLGPTMQNISMLDGYDQRAEDRLLDSVDWRADGYELFRIACLAGSSAGGWFRPLAESNFLTVKRAAWERLGGLDERFRSRGGGFVNLDYYREACERLGQLVILLGEGTFHQYHGGVATNVPLAEHPGLQFQDEYVVIRGRDFAAPTAVATYLGGMPSQSLPYLATSLQQAIAAAGGES
jgi:glycosyltransferase involved in cell wall biosynthesis